jgi:hypothetical protein
MGPLRRDSLSHCIQLSLTEPTEKEPSNLSPEKENRSNFEILCSAVSLEYRMMDKAHDSSISEIFKSFPPFRML